MSIYMNLTLIVAHPLMRRHPFHPFGLVLRFRKRKTAGFLDEAMMIASKRFLLAALAAGALMISAGQKAAATPISPPAVVLLSDVASQTGTLSFTVGGLLFEFGGCTGDCSANTEIIGVPGSPGNPGGGIRLQSITSDPILSSGDFHLEWRVTAQSGGDITGISSSSTSGGAASGSIGTTVYLPPDYNTGPGTLTVATDVSPESMTLAIMTGSLAMNSDFTGTIASGDIFVSQVPEPASIALLLTGMIGLAARRRRAT
jgi:hypothetical protein